MASGQHGRPAGDSKVCMAKSMAMKLMAMPASVDRSAARGVCRRMQSATKEPRELDRGPRRGRTASPTCQASVRRCARVDAALMGRELHRQHHQEDVGEEGHGVDAVGQGGDVGAAGAGRELLCLPGVEDVADQDRDAPRRAARCRAPGSSGSRARATESARISRNWIRLSMARPKKPSTSPGTNQG